MKILTIEDCKRLWVIYHSYSNGDYEYEVDGIWHLIRDGKDLLEGLNAYYFYSYDNGDYTYKVDGIWHLIREGKDLLKGIKATWFYPHKNGDYTYYVDDQYVRLNKNGDKL